MIAYGTELSCNQTHLFYPSSVPVIEEFEIQVHRIDIGSKYCVDRAEKEAKQVLENTA